MSLTLIIVMLSLAVPLVAIVLLITHLIDKSREFLNARYVSSPAWTSGAGSPT